MLFFDLFPEDATRSEIVTTFLAMLELLKLNPIVDAGLRLGEGTGASLAIVVLQSALDVYNQLHK